MPLSMSRSRSFSAVCCALSVETSMVSGAAKKGLRNAGVYLKRLV
jgi:hypothetical protein